MPRCAVRRRGFLLVETLAALFAASIFLAAALSMFSACAGLLSRSRAQLAAELAASAAISAILSGEEPDGVVSSETVYGGGLTFRRVTLENPHSEGASVVVLPERNFR